MGSTVLCVVVAPVAVAEQIVVSMTRVSVVKIVVVLVERLPDAATPAVVMLRARKGLMVGVEN